MYSRYFYVGHAEAKEQLRFKRGEDEKTIKCYYLKTDIQTLRQKAAFMEMYSKNKQEPYLSALLSMVEQLDGVKTEAEREQLFQALSLACWRPSFWFGGAQDWSEKVNGVRKEVSSTKSCCFQEDEYGNYLKVIKKFYTELEQYRLEVQAYTTYAKRGTTDLDRHSGQTAVSENTLQQLEIAVNQCFYQYSMLVQALGLTCKSKRCPKVDTKLLNNCIEKGWLLPLAHVILIRYAQYQMMDIRKHRKDDLLTGNAKCFEAKEPMSVQQKSDVSRVTYVFSKKIQHLLATQLSADVIVNPTREAYARKQEELLKWANESTLSAISYLPSLMDLRSTYIDIMKYEFPAVYADTDILALWLSNHLGLNNQQTKVLKDALPKVLWERRNIKKTLAELKIVVPKLEQQLSALRGMLTPQIHCTKSTRPHKIKGVEQFVQYLNLTPVTLLYSHATEASANLHTVAPEFLMSCIAHLEKNTGDYVRNPQI